MFYRRSNEFKLVGYCDVDFARDSVEQKVHMEAASFWEETVSRGTVRSNQLLHSQLQKQSI